MRKTRNHEILCEVFDQRIGILEILNSPLSRIAADELQNSVSALESLIPKVGLTDVAERYQSFTDLLKAFCFLVRWITAVRSAEPEADRYLRAAKQIAADVRQIVQQEKNVFNTLIDSILSISQTEEVLDVGKKLASVPLPLPFTVKMAESANRVTENPKIERHQVTIVFASFTVGNQPFLNPHTIEPETLFDLNIEIRVSNWPDSTERLILEPVSVEPIGTYEMPRFVFERPNGNPPFVLQQSGRMLLHYPQAISSRPLEFRYRAFFESDENNFDMSVEGQRSLRVQSYDPRLNPITGLPELDLHLTEIRNELRKFPGINDESISDFLTILTRLAAIASSAIQDNMYPKKLTEAEFQNNLKEKLRMDARLASGLEEAPKAAGGITDLSYKKIRIELKVEPDVLVDEAYAENYLAQTNQYVTGSAKLLGILAILDCSEKKSGVGSVLNDIFLKVVPPPQGGSFPIVIGVIVVRGNLPKPSSLS